MNKIEDRKPKNGTTVIAKTASNLLIPCLYEDGKFFKLVSNNYKIERYCEIESVIEWQYEINLDESKKINSGDIMVELLCQRYGYLNDKGVKIHDNWTDLWNEIPAKDRSFIIAQIDRVLEQTSLIKQINDYFIKFLATRME